MIDVMITITSVKEILKKVAGADGEICQAETERIEAICADLESVGESVVLSPLTVLCLLFDVAIADGELDMSELSILEEIAEASDSLGVSLAAFREAWDLTLPYHERVRRVGLLPAHMNRAEGMRYSVGHAVVDIAGTLRRTGADDIKVHLLSDDIILVSAASRGAGLVSAKPVQVIGLRQRTATVGSLLTRSLAALEFHIAAAGGLVSGVTTIFSINNGECAISFGLSAVREMVSATVFEEAQRRVVNESHELGVLLFRVFDVGCVSLDRVFEEILVRAEERLHRWATRGCPGGQCRFRIQNYCLDIESDPFHKEAFPGRSAKSIIEVRPGLVLDVQVFELCPVALRLAYRVSEDADMVTLAGYSKDGLLQGLPAPGVYLYDEFGRCVLREHIPDVDGVISNFQMSTGSDWIARSRVRIDVLERPNGTGSADCLNFSSLWMAIARMIF